MSQTPFYSFANRVLPQVFTADRSIFSVLHQQAALNGGQAPQVSCLVNNQKFEPEGGSHKKTSYSGHGMCLIFSGLVLLFIILAGVAGKDILGLRIMFLIWALVAYIFYLINCRRCVTLRYLSNLLELPSAQNYLASLRQERPKLIQAVDCWHTETRTRTVTRTVNGRSQTHTETYTVKVTTLYKECEFFYDVLMDESGLLEGIEKHPLVKIDLQSICLFDDPASYSAFDQKKDLLLSTYRHVDTNIDYSHYWIFNNFKHNIMVYTDQEGVRAEREAAQLNADKPLISRQQSMTLQDGTERPYTELAPPAVPRSVPPKQVTAVSPFLTTGWFWFFSFILLSWPYRVWLDSLAPKSKYKVIKRIGVAPINLNSINATIRINIFNNNNNTGRGAAPPVAQPVAQPYGQPYMPPQQPQQVYMPAQQTQPQQMYMPAQQQPYMPPQPQPGIYMPSAQPAQPQQYMPYQPNPLVYAAQPPAAVAQQPPMYSAQPQAPLYPLQQPLLSAPYGAMPYGGGPMAAPASPSAAATTDAASSSSSFEMTKLAAPMPVAPSAPQATNNNNDPSAPPPSYS